MTSNGRRSGPGLHENDGPFESGYDLGVLDPGHLDDTYWARFRFRVVTRATDELVRRREMADVTVLEFAQSWARVLVPAAAVAAAVGALLLSQGRTAAPLAVAGPEEVLTRELEDRTLPDFMALEEAEDGAFLLAGGTY
jgi:hypothetical protein